MSGPDRSHRMYSGEVVVVLVLLVLLSLLVGYRLGRLRAEWGRAWHDSRRAWGRRGNYRGDYRDDRDW